MADVSVNGIVAPHGGRLVDRILRGGALEEASRRASSLKRIALNARTMSDLELLAGGAYSPLEGFMGKADYRSVLDDMRLANGLPWTLPITLAVRRSAAFTSRSDSSTTAARRPASSTERRIRGIPGPPISSPAGTSASRGRST